MQGAEQGLVTEIPLKASKPNIDTYLPQFSYETDRFCGLHVPLLLRSFKPHASTVKMGQEKPRSTRKNSDCSNNASATARGIQLRSAMLTARIAWPRKNRRCVKRTDAKKTESETSALYVSGLKQKKGCMATVVMVW